MKIKCSQLMQQILEQIEGKFFLLTILADSDFSSSAPYFKMFIGFIEPCSLAWKHKDKFTMQQGA